MVQPHHEVASRTDYLLDTNQRTFSNLTVKDPHHNSNHFMFIG